MSVVIPSCWAMRVFPWTLKQAGRQAAWHSEQSIACQMSVMNNFLPALIANSGGEQQALEINE